VLGAALRPLHRSDFSLRFVIRSLRGVSFAVGEKLGGKVSQAALEFSSFIFIQGVMLKRLQ
jgi:hypothetical protein